LKTCYGVKVALHGTIVSLQLIEQRPSKLQSLRSIFPHINGASLSTYKIETTQPVHKHAIVPPISARIASFENIFARFGAKELIAPIIMPIEAKTPFFRTDPLL